MCAQSKICRYLRGPCRGEGILTAVQCVNERKRSERVDTVFSIRDLCGWQLLISTASIFNAAAVAVTFRKVHVRGHPAMKFLTNGACGVIMQTLHR